MRIRTVIVDDEPLAREGVALALRGYDDVEVIAECADGGAAIRAIRELAPDLVFLDIKMPGLSGFDVVEAVGPARMPVVIFLTAYEEHAARAFRVNAVDYLLKPIDEDDFGESLDRARRRITQNDLLKHRDQLRELLDDLAGPRTADTPGRIVVRTTGRVHFLDPREIDWVEASGDYVTIHAAGQDHLIRESMKSMEARLRDHGFRRIHRSSLVNVGSIRELVIDDHGEYRVVLRNGTVLRLGRSYKDALYASLTAAARVT
jgi:two-component system, LytTR family, response regulator